MAARQKRKIWWAISLLLVMLYFSGLTAQAQYGGGSGEPNDPYVIYTAKQMNEIGLHEDDWDKHFKLMADIDLSGYTGTDFNIIGYYLNWDDNKPFTGVFDGNDHTISNFSYISTEANEIGLFGCANGPNAEIKDLGLIDPNVDAGTGVKVGSLIGWLRDGTITGCYVEGGSVSGFQLVGGLVGFLTWESTITNCYATAAVLGVEDVGGLVGANNDTITYCYSIGNVTGRSRLGALVGSNEGPISNCYSTGSVSGDRFVGGLVGQNGGTYSEREGMAFPGDIDNCYSRCSVTGTAMVGGLVGYNNVGTITKCYATGSVMGTADVGGLVGAGNQLGFWRNEVTFSFWDTQTSGQPTSEGGTEKTTAEMQMESAFTDAGWDFVGESVNGTEDIWKISDGLDYPRLWWEKYGGGSGEPNDPYLIYTAEQMNEIGANRNDWDKHFKLMADIDLSSFTGTDFNIIGYYVGWDSPDNRPFTGGFDGNGHIISNFSYTSTDTDYIGLFRYVDGENAQIKDLGLIDPNVDGGTGVYVGSLVGELWNGTVTGCYVKGGSVVAGLAVGGLVGYNYEGKITNCYATGSVDGEEEVGGLAGINWDGTITNCYSTASVSGGNGAGGLVGANSGRITNCYATGSVSGDKLVGGLVGSSEYGGRIINCYTNCNVTGGDYVGGLAGGIGGEVYIPLVVPNIITNCYSIGGVSGRNLVGGLVGWNYEGTITNCYSSASVSGNDYVGGLVGDNFFGSIATSYSSGAVSGTSGVGGLVGLNAFWGSIDTSYSTGTVSGNSKVGGLVGENVFVDLFGDESKGIITTSYSIGTVTGNENVGGLVGSGWASDVTNCFWDMETSGQTTSSGGTGKTTAEMQTESTFTDAGWDFVGESVNGIEDIWSICEGTNYPRLAWQIPPGDFVCPDGITIEDFVFFIEHWRDDNCDISNDYCQGTDLDFSGTVDEADLEILVENWLESGNN